MRKIYTCDDITKYYIDDGFSSHSQNVLYCFSFIHSKMLIKISRQSNQIDDETFFGLTSRSSISDAWMKWYFYLSHIHNPPVILYLSKNKLSFWIISDLNKFYALIIFNIYKYELIPNFHLLPWTQYMCVCHIAGCHEDH